MSEWMSEWRSEDGSPLLRNSLYATLLLHSLNRYFLHLLTRKSDSVYVCVENVYLNALTHSRTHLLTRALTRSDTDTDPPCCDGSNDTHTLIHSTRLYYTLLTTIDLLRLLMNE
jgi:hypothetical protein